MYVRVPLFFVLRPQSNIHNLFHQIFIMTTLHHHVSISHISVSQPYLRFLETGKMPNPEHEFFKNGEGWDKLKIQKTRFWDLLDPSERVDAARAISGVLNWLSREEVKR